MTVAIVPLTTVTAGAASKVSTGGTAVVAMFGNVQGGMIYNPLTAAEQGIGTAETLFVDFVNPATTFESPTTFPLYPGASIRIPAGTTNNVSVNAVTSGHKFSAFIIQPLPVPVPTPQPFPPTGPTGLTATIPAYLYVQYQDDDTLQAFVAAYNSLAQGYVDWFNQTVLANYTSLVGALLDWVGQGLYGLARPSLSTGLNRYLGPINTWALNTLAINRRETLHPGGVVVVSDDIYKRIITWHFFKGDGKVFTIRWLKRRVMRFLIGTNGLDPGVNQTYAISVTFGANNQVTITLNQGKRLITGGAIPNRFALNTQPFNKFDTVFFSNPDPLPNGPILQEAVASMVLELPFQFTWKVVV